MCDGKRDTCAWWYDDECHLECNDQFLGWCSDDANHSGDFIAGHACVTLWLACEEACIGG
jgi:hypothetical protein